jgi:hypothetical protein
LCDPIDSPDQLSADASPCIFHQRVIDFVVGHLNLLLLALLHPPQLQDHGDQKIQLLSTQVGRILLLCLRDLFDEFVDGIIQGTQEFGYLSFLFDGGIDCLVVDHFLLHALVTK